MGFEPTKPYSDLPVFKTGALNHALPPFQNVAALIGLEPITTRVEDECSIQLSYKAKIEPVIGCITSPR